MGSHTILASIIEMVERTRSSKASVQRIDDKVMGCFISIILFIAEQSIAFAITIFTTVLVVSCRCAWNCYSYGSISGNR
jgi:Cu+-exporting ATPase